MIFTIDELIIDDSFILYCLETDQDALKKWNNYLMQYPDQLLAMQEAKEIVLGLRLMLQKKQNELSADKDNWQNKLYVPTHSKQKIETLLESDNTLPRRRRRRLLLVAASIICMIILGGVIYQFKPSLPSDKTIAVNNKNVVKEVVVKPGEKQTIYLSDSTMVVLNANTELHVDKEFGIKNRNVYLVGEALFDVAHNKQLPFVVHIKQYKVKAVGTKFNVKAYKNDLFSETSLLEGKVQILMNKGKHEVVYKTLAVNQKFVFENKQPTIAAPQVPTEYIMPLKYDDLKQNIETAWVDNQLIFDTQSLGEIAKILERRFAVTISIKDEGVKNYKYTASFKEETLNEILKALQLSFHFTYKKEGNYIIIHK